MKKSIKFGIIGIGILIYLSFLLTTYKSDFLKIGGTFDICDNATGLVECIDNRNWVIDNATDGKSTQLQIMNLPMYARKKGSYTLDFTCDVEKTGAYIEITTDGITLPDNTVQKVIVHQELQPDQKNYSMKFQLKEYCQNISMQVYYPGTGYFNIGIPYYCSTFKYYHDSEFMLILSLGVLLAAGIIYKKKISRRLCYQNQNGDILLSHSGIFVFSIGLGMIASIPYLGTALNDSADLQFHFMRITGLAQAIVSGQFPVRIQPYWIANYGYPVSMFYPDLFLYIPAGMIGLGVSELFAFKMFVILINILTVLFSFVAFRKLVKSDSLGAVITIFYELSMYRFLNLYNRCDIAEALAMIFLPWVLYGMYAVLWGECKDAWMLIVGFSGIVGSHILSIEFAGFLCIIMVILGIVQLRNRSRLRALLKCGVITILLNLYFIVPFLSASRLPVYLLKYKTSRIDETGVFLSQMFNSFVATDGENNWGTSTIHEMPLSFGVLIGVGILLYLYIRHNNHLFVLLEKRKWTNIADVACIGGLLFAWVSSALFPWHYVKRIPIIGVILSAAQFAWRYYMLATLQLCIVAAVACYIVLSNKIGTKAVVVVCFVLALVNVSPFIDNYGNTHAPYMEDKYSYAFEFDKYSENADYLYDGLSTDQLRERLQIITSNVEGISFDSYVKKGVNLSFKYHKTDGTESAEIYTTDLFYPGYKVMINGEKAEAFEGENHIHTIRLLENMPKDGVITVKYVGTWYMWCADLITIMTLLYCLIKIGIGNRMKCI